MRFVDVLMRHGHARRRFMSDNLGADKMSANAEVATLDVTRRIRPFVVSLFFVWGFATVLVDSLIPKLKAQFTLTYAEVMLTQFAFFLAYFLFSVPLGMLLARVGYIRGIVIGLAVMAAGCLLFIPASSMGVFGVFLLALFVMASGITMLQVAANPLMALLGSPETSHSRLNLAQAFNSFGTFVGPFVGASVILAAGSTQGPFVGIAVGLVVIVFIFWQFRDVDHGVFAVEPGQGLAFGVLRERRLALGALSIFTYVGAEVSIGSLMTNYLMQDYTLGLIAQKAGHLVAFYWGGAMVGRFIGSAVLQRVRAGTVLCVCALGAATLVTSSSLSVGAMAAATLIAVGLCNSIMFPTIFTLGIEKLGSHTPQGSAMLCLAIVGGAIVPVITGFVADHSSLQQALWVPVVCYLWIAIYGWLARGSALD